MICPNCNYIHGYHWVEEEFKEIKGEHGDFFSLPITLSRESLYSHKEEVQVFSCPSCRIVFSGDHI